MYFILLIIRSDVLIFHSWQQSACQQLFWHWEKLNFLNKLISETFCLFGFEIKQCRFSAYQDQVCAWLSESLVSLDYRLRLLENYFCIIFWKKRLQLSFSGFSNLLNASARLFCTLFFAQSRKILSQFSKLSAILKRQRQKLCNDDVNRASVL